MKALRYINWETVGKWSLGIGVAQLLRIWLRICLSPFWANGYIILYIPAALLVLWGILYFIIFSDRRETVLNIAMGYYTFGTVVCLIICAIIYG